MIVPQSSNPLRWQGFHSQETNMTEQAQGVKVKDNVKDKDVADCFICKKKVDKKKMMILPYAGNRKVYICTHHIHD